MQCKTTKILHYFTQWFAPLSREVRFA